MQQLAPATARPGRRCVLCSHPDRAQIEFDLTAGTSSIRGVAGQYGLAPESVRRHVRDHLTAAARAALVGVDGAPALTLASRLLDVADHARDTRAAAEAAGDHKTALHAGQAEARVLAVLAPLDTLGSDIAEAIEDAEDALRLIGTVVREHPEVAAVIVNVLEQKNRSDWADQIRQIANPDSRNELTS
ncbi:MULTISPECIES: hypothetical protein [Microbacterium]|uniref:hypothetical protein n=1 Tax=Microbacterium TaxID=33882 RepID=UPI0028E9A028|nr:MULTISPECIES: hypothetical protein [Microbacterium]